VVLNLDGVRLICFLKFDVPRALRSRLNIRRSQDLPGLDLFSFVFPAVQSVILVEALADEKVI